MVNTIATVCATSKTFLRKKILSPRGVNDLGLDNWDETLFSKRKTLSIYQ
jgi:hypothetical protein